MPVVNSCPETCTLVHVCQHGKLKVTTMYCKFQKRPGTSSGAHLILRPQHCVPHQQAKNMPIPPDSLQHLDFKLRGCNCFSGHAICSTVCNIDKQPEAWSHIADSLHWPGYSMTLVRCLLAYFASSSATATASSIGCQ